MRYQPAFALALIGLVLWGIGIVLGAAGSPGVADALGIAGAALILVAWVGRLVATTREKRWGLFAWTLFWGIVLILLILGSQLYTSQHGSILLSQPDQTTT